MTTQTSDLIRAAIAHENAAGAIHTHTVAPHLPIQGTLDSWRARALNAAAQVRGICPEADTLAIRASVTLDLNEARDIYRAAGHSYRDAAR